LATLEPIHGQFRQGFNAADLIEANELIGKLQTA